MLNFKPRILIRHCSKYSRFGSIKMEFDGKVAIVTGSTSGMGEQIAMQFARNGAKVVVHGRNETRLNQVVEKCLNISPLKQKPLGIIADIKDDEQLKNLVDTTVATFGKIDVLVNCAGVFGVFRPVEDPDLTREFDTVNKSNLRPVVVLSSLVIPHLIASKGCIVNISGNAATKPTVGWVCQCATEAAKWMLTRSMALELGPKGVRVNCVRPGYINTPAYPKNGYVFEEMEDLLKQPLKKHGQPSDVANAVLFLASSKSAFITGAAIDVDGGINDA